MNAVPVDGASSRESEHERPPNGGDAGRAEDADAVEAGGRGSAKTPREAAPTADAPPGTGTAPEPGTERRAETGPEIADDADGNSDDTADQAEAAPATEPVQEKASATEPVHDEAPATEPVHDEGSATEPGNGKAPAPGPPAVLALSPDAGHRDPDPEPAREAALPAHDLPAEPAGTPPPPMAPTRTLARRSTIWTPLVLLAAVVFVVVQALRPLPEAGLHGAEVSYTLPGRFEVPWPDHGQGAVHIPGSGQVAVFGPQRPVPTASVAKIMTAYVILRDHPLRKGEEGPRITVDDKAVADGTATNESRIEGLTAGTTFSQQDMLKMLMIPSGNNVARLLARWDGHSDSTAPFVAKMNAAAEDLGMRDTTYTDPSGLDSRTVSTPVDQLKLAEAVMKSDVFRAIVAMPNATIKGLPKPLYNNNDNLLLAGLSIKGIKTGSSTPAGGTLVWAAYKTVGSRTPLILGSMMGQRADGPDPDALRSLALVKSRSEKVVAAVRAGLTSVTVVPRGQVVGHVRDRLGRRVPVVAASDLTVIGVPGQKLDAVLSVKGRALPLSAPAGTEVATLTVGSGPQAPSIPVALREKLAEPTFLDRLARLK
ncbi:serine hydrolase [Streptomyces sp. NPDC053755]|uniref:serine hydrolase n=1 Tax=Streptomyces sp. NPDC053755 TaxID=3155815 RepID=UPI00341C95C0